MPLQTHIQMNLSILERTHLVNGLNSSQESTHNVITACEVLAPPPLPPSLSSSSSPPSPTPSPTPSSTSIPASCFLLRSAAARRRSSALRSLLLSPSSDGSAKASRFLFACRINRLASFFLFLSSYFRRVSSLGPAEAVTGPCVFPESATLPPGAAVTARVLPLPPASSASGSTGPLNAPVTAADFNSDSDSDPAA